MLLTRILGLLAVVWLLGAAYMGAQSIPVLPMDVSASDPATLEALNAARMRHGLTWGAIALAPLLLVIIVGRFLRR